LDAFYLFFLPICQLGLLILCGTEVVRAGMPVLFFTLEEKLGFSLLRISVMAFYIAFICEGPPG
jgi:hypothetical protein